MNQYDVYPAEDGMWAFRLRAADGEVLYSEDGYEDRSAAISAARGHRGDDRVPLYYEDGSFAAMFNRNRGNEGLYIYNADGSLYGEVDHPIKPGNDGPPQRVSLGTAGEE
jgi:uncharacterized protein YegP (UPF0339 family)